MALSRGLALAVVIAGVAGCATTIAPTYTSQNPDIMRIGGTRPVAQAPVIESNGSFCIQTTEQWNEHGKTPDGQSLWAKDTLRTVVPCK